MLLELKDVSKRLGKFHIKNISMELPEGYILGLIGPNGSGKTSLIHLILGLYKPSQGDIFIDGKSYTDDEMAIRNMIGTVLLDEMFDDGVSLLSNGIRYGRYYEKFNQEILETYLKRFNLDKKRKYNKLSKGEKLKFQFAFALSHDARLLILDEPTGNFDPEFRKEFFQVIKEFIADGTRSVIISTHLTEDLDKVADYILYIENGDTIFSGDIEKLRDSYRLVTGENYKINLIDKDRIIHKEVGNYGTRALVTHRPRYTYDKEVTVTIPTLEEVMYFVTKRDKGGRRR